jgi:hypothetical protein
VTSFASARLINGVVALNKGLTCRQCQCTPIQTVEGARMTMKPGSEGRQEGRLGRSLLCKTEPSSPAGQCSTGMAG